MASFVTGNGPDDLSSLSWEQIEAGYTQELSSNRYTQDTYDITEEQAASLPLIGSWVQKYDAMQQCFYYVTHSAADVVHLSHQVQGNASAGTEDSELSEQFRYTRTCKCVLMIHTSGLHAILHIVISFMQYALRL